MVKPGWMLVVRFELYSALRKACTVEGRLAHRLAKCSRSDPVNGAAGSAGREERMAAMEGTAGTGTP